MVYALHIVPFCLLLFFYQFSFAISVTSFSASAIRLLFVSCVYLLCSPTFHSFLFFPSSMCVTTLPQMCKHYVCAPVIFTSLDGCCFYHLISYATSPLPVHDFCHRPSPRAFIGTALLCSYVTQFLAHACFLASAVKRRYLPSLYRVFLFILFLNPPTTASVLTPKFSSFLKCRCDLCPFFVSHKHVLLFFSIIFFFAAYSHVTCVCESTYLTMCLRVSVFFLSAFCVSFFLLASNITLFSLSFLFLILVFPFALLRHIS